MRILIAHAFYRVPGGEDGYVRQQAELLGRDHAVELFETRNEDLASSAAAARRMLRTEPMGRRLESVVRTFRPDVIHVHNVYPSLGAAPFRAGRRTRTPVVLTVHNHRLRCPNGYRFTEGNVCDRCVGGNHLHAVTHDCFPSKGQSVAYAATLWLDRFVRRVERSVALFIAPSEYMAERLRTWGIPATRVVVIRNFTAERPEPASVGEHGVYAGRLSSEKGLDVLLHALRQAEDPPFHILGDGPLRGALQGLANRLGLQRVTFHGHLGRAEVDRLLGGARYFVMPSLSDENAPLAVMEAMAAGVPSIVTRRGGLPELDQVVVDAGEPDELARAIERLRADDELHAEVSSRARRFATDHLAEGDHLARLTSAYASVLGAGVSEAP